MSLLKQVTSGLACE